MKPGSTGEAEAVCLMVKPGKLLMSVVCFIVVTGVTALAGPLPKRLVLIGGGKRPPVALARFVEWAGGKRARILVIPWASGEPRESSQALANDLNPFGPAEIETAPFALKGDDAAKTKFLAQMGRATGVFFTGGDQGRIMDVLQDQTLLEVLRSRYQAGVVFGGTSAGMAVMSPIMLTGEGNFEVIDGEQVGTRPGLGLLPGTIVDQHFLKRGRENRLFGLIRKYPAQLGIGVDEDNALLVTNHRLAEAVGPTHAMFIDARRVPGALTVHLVKSGEYFDLVKRRPGKKP